MDPWRFRLVQTSNMNLIGRLRARSRALTIGLDQSGSAGFELPLDDPMAPMISNVSTGVIAAKFDPIQQVFVDRWGGPVWTVEEQLDQNKMTVNCVGWFEQLAHRFLGLTFAPQISYQNTDRVQIAVDLIAKINSVYKSWITTQSTGLPTTINATRTYQTGVQIANEIQALSQIESGYDWWMDPYKRIMNFYASRGQDRPNSIFKYGVWGSNLQSCQRQIDSSTLCNFITVNGKYGVTTSQDANSQSQYGMFEDWVTLSDVVDNTVLNAYAASEIILRSQPRQIWSIVPLSSDRDGVPRLFDDYDMGDTIRLTAKSDPIATVQGGITRRINVQNQALRVFAVSLNIDDNGVEKITQLQTSLGL